MTPDIDNIRFNVLRNALYHTARRLTYERWNRLLNFAVVLLGASAMSAIVAKWQVELYVGAAVAVAGSLQLVFDFGGAARDHQALQRDYYNLLADIEATPHPTEEDAAGFYSRMIRLTGEERPTMKAIDARAYNDAIDATGLFPQTERLRVPMHHRLFGRWVPFSGYEYRKIGEIKQLS